MKPRWFLKSEENKHLGPESLLECSNVHFLPEAMVVKPATIPAATHYTLDSTNTIFGAIKMAHLEPIWSWIQKVLHHGNKPGCHANDNVDDKQQCVPSTDPRGTALDCYSSLYIMTPKSQQRQECWSSSCGLFFTDHLSPEWVGQDGSTYETLATSIQPLDRRAHVGLSLGDVQSIIQHSDALAVDVMPWSLTSLCLNYNSDDFSSHRTHHGNENVDSVTPNFRRTHQEQCLSLQHSKQREKKQMEYAQM